jgi:predicted permease
VHFEQNLIQAIVVIFSLILLAMGLRRVGLVQEEYAQIFAGLVTEVTLPALIFISLAKQRVAWQEITLPATMMAAELACLALAWLIASLLRLDRPQKGAFILASGFGTSAFLGYVVVQQVFPGKVMALTDAVFISEIGVGFLIFTLGVFIALYYGANTDRVRSQAAAETLKFFRSPIFISLALGPLVSFFPQVSDTIVMATIYNFLHVLAKANTVLVILTIGLLLQVRRLGSVLLLAVLAGLIKLILQPFLVFLPSLWHSYPELWRKVLVLEAAMPSATLAAVYSKRYGCDAGLASLIIFVTVFLSTFTVLGLLSLL